MVIGAAIAHDNDRLNFMTPFDWFAPSQYPGQQEHRPQAAGAVDYGVRPCHRGQGGPANLEIAWSEYYVGVESALAADVVFSLVFWSPHCPNIGFEEVLHWSQPVRVERGLVVCAQLI
eukprot:scaffold91464_cov31-Prasinocladus_malaysianus.AAC.1